MENKKQSEIVAVQDLLELLDLKGIFFTMDVLHCQKADAIHSPYRGKASARTAQIVPASYS